MNHYEVCGRCHLPVCACPENQRFSDLAKLIGATEYLAAARAKEADEIVRALATTGNPVQIDAYGAVCTQCRSCASCSELLAHKADCIYARAVKYAAHPGGSGE